MSSKHRIVCPCCDARLVVDADSGEILSHERPKADTTKTFHEAMDKVRSGSKRREEAFSKAFDRTRKLDELLSKKFEEAREKADKDEGRPTNPLDLD